MSIPLSARTVDLANLIVAKGSNFVLTAVLFALLTPSMDSRAFAEFGYWWSIALMIGGVLLGGLSSALVRVAAVHKSLHHVIGSLRHAGLASLVLATVLALGHLVIAGRTTLGLLLVGVTLFGIAVQVQTAVLTLLRAAEATRANISASVLIVLLVPLSLHLMLGDQRALPWIFLALAASFALGAVAAFGCARQSLGHLLTPVPVDNGGSLNFLRTASSFMAINVFSYAIVNVDFTLFRLIGAPADFAVMATAKVFFERFVLPALMVFAGAVSLRVLRHPHGPGDSAPHLEADLTPRILVVALIAISLLAVAYVVFAAEIRGDATTIALPWVACAAGGYFLFAVNGILFDVLVVRRSLVVVVLNVAAFLLLSCVIQAIAIRGFGVPGWAIGWLSFNMLVALILAREGLKVRVRCRSASVGKDGEVGD